MKNFKSLLLSCLGSFFLIGIFSNGIPVLGKTSHGGTYRGPGDTVPPGGGGGGGGSGPNTAGPVGPSAPGGGGPNTPGPAGPSAPGGSGGGRRGPSTAGRSIGPDLTQWTFWWEFNKDPYLSLKNKIHKGGPKTGGDDFFLGFGQREQGVDLNRPGRVDIKTKIVPALVEALETQNNNDIITGCLMSLAKIGNLDGETNFGEKIVPFLADSNQEISETAALALGILGSEKYIDLLNNLVTEAPAGKRAVGRTHEVPYRTRTFAVYALGLIASNSTDVDTISSVSNILRNTLAVDNSSYKDIKIASIVSMSLLKLNHDTRKEQVDLLLDYFRNESNNHLVRAHIPEAISFSIMGASKDTYEAYKRILAMEFMERVNVHSKESREVQQSCVIGLGLLGDADDSELDKKIRESLYAIPKSVPDQQTRAFALIALGNVGSNKGSGENSFYATKEVQSYLIRNIVRGKTFVKPWATISLGVLANHLSEGKVAVSPAIYEVLRSGINEEKSPTRVSAVSVATGLAGSPELGELLLKKLRVTKDAEAQGYLCVSLGLLNHRGAIEDITHIVEKSKYRPALLQQAAIGLGLMGDRNLVNELVGMLKESKSLGSQASIVMALSFIGDSRSIDPLVSLLSDETYTETARGFAAVALGMVADRTMLPWNSDLSCDLNYRASTPTLNAVEGTGVLNIL
jgi:HEAT repeat protein